MKVYKTWTQLKSIVDARVLTIRYQEDSIKYDIFAIDGNLEYLTEIWIDKTKVKGIDEVQNDIDRTDFENNYKPIANNKSFVGKITLTNKEATRFVEITVDGRLKVSQEPPVAPVGTTPIKFIAKGNMNGTEDTLYIIPDGLTLTIQRLSGGAEGDSTSGTIIELFEDPNGDLSVLNPIDDIYASGNSTQKDLNEHFVGDGTKRILLRRRRLTGGTKEVTGRWEGYIE